MPDYQREFELMTAACEALRETLKKQTDMIMDLIAVIQELNTKLEEAER